MISPRLNATEQAPPGRVAPSQQAAIARLPFVQTDPATVQRYSRTTGVHPTTPLAVAYPQTVADVQRIVALASEHGLAVYPVSRGCNWGYGDACAPTQGQVILDLSRMNRIVEVNERLAYAVIEPGVTQGQLADYLKAHHPNLWMDCTGAGRDASIVGNALDRGFGHSRYGDHVQTACGMEVVLADGRVLNTGYGHYDNVKADRAYSYGIGPSLDGLFAQSNMGIVTQMGVWLMPKPEAFSMYVFTSPDDAALEQIIEGLAPLRMQGLLQSTIHIANDLRLISARTRYPWERAGGQTPLPHDLRQELRRELGVGAWSGCGGIYGTHKTVAAVKGKIRQALRGHEVVFVDDRKLAMAERVHGVLGRIGLGRALGAKIELVKTAYGLLKGEPSNEALRGAAWRVRGEVADEPVDPREIHAGLLWASPVLPTTGEAAREVLGLIEPIYQRHGFEMLATFTMITERAMIGVTNLAFDRREAEECARAAACYQELSETLLRHGYPPYRSGPGGFDKLAQGSSVFWDVAAEIKQALDPGNVISPGRYQPNV